MKKLLFFVILLFVQACGSTDVLNIDQVTFPIYVPTNFGIEKTDGSRCDTDWSGGTCYVPDTKTRRFFVDPSCPTWYRQRMQNAVIDMNSFGSPFGWNVQLVNTNDPWAFYDFYFYCEQQATAPVARTWFTSNQDCHDTELGELCQTRSGYIAIRPNYVESKPIFQNATPAQKIRYVANSLRHEVGHAAFNFGHLPGSQQGKKLMAKGYPDDLLSDAWNQFLGPDDDELRALDCYNQNSGTEPLCD